MGCRSLAATASFEDTVIYATAPGGPGTFGRSASSPEGGGRGVLGLVVFISMVFCISMVNGTKCIYPELVASILDLGGNLYEDPEFLVICL